MPLPNRSDLDQPMVWTSFKAWLHSLYDYLAAAVLEVGAIIEKSLIKAQNLDLITTGKNLFSSATISPAQYIGPAGTLLASATYNTSAHIRITAGQTYKPTATLRFIGFYDVNQAIILPLLEPTTAAAVVAPVGAAYVRLTMFVAQTATLQLELGAVSTAFESYRFSLTNPAGVPLSVPGTMLTDNSVTLAKATFKKPGKNLFYKGAVTTGQYLSVSGALLPNAVYNTSAYMAAVPAQAYKPTAVLRYVAFFDSALAIILPLLEPSTAAAITSPAGTAYMRATLFATDNDTLQVELGTVSTGYEEHHLLLDNPGGAPIRALPLIESVAATMAAKQYVVAGKAVNFYPENCLKFPRKLTLPASFSIPGSVGEGVSNAYAPATAGAAISANLSSLTDDAVAVPLATFTVTPTSPTLTTACAVLHIGDSLTYRMTWANVIMGLPANTGLTFLGTRTATGAAVVSEGQGGWKMEHYHTADFGGYLSPFMQPITAGYKYFGKTSFWIDANSGTPSYSAGNFPARTQYNATTGRRLTPAINDVMGDGAGYIRWDGAAWVAITIGTLGGFAFSFAKYRAAFGVAAPNVVHIMLGTNDFFAATALTFAGIYATYKAQYDVMIASIKADTPACKIVIGIPPPSARQGPHGTTDTERVKLAMWLLAEALNRDYSGLEVSQAIYLLDYHSVVDRVYGFDNTAGLPYADYTGTDRLLYKADITHPSLDGFKQMGNVYAGLVQAIR
jgi:hypothetical protein